MDPVRRDGAASSTRLLSGFHTEPARDPPRRQPARRAAAADARRAHGRCSGSRPREVAGDAVPLDAAWGATARELVDRLAVRQRPGRSASPCSTGCCCDRGRPAPRCRPTCARRRRGPGNGSSRPTGASTSRRWPGRSGGATATSPSSSPTNSASGRRRWPGSCGSSARSGWSCVPTGRRLPRSRPIAGTPTRPMARDWRALAGHSPTQWLAAEELPLGHAESVDTAA